MVTIHKFERIHFSNISSADPKWMDMAPAVQQVFNKTDHARWEYKGKMAFNRHKARSLGFEKGGPNFPNNDYYLASKW
ncbi:hypothetical protein DPMN_184599 [Dreissena polymorpha]|uniref:Uncharacterized protein n=1 Tax=Dreissena polymorpha TaxID=45954 RepID=A0A9D4I7K1_DREPO|nr:hypothetical protein DPMN_184599 [Dreissena polymorpha]